MGLNSPRDNSPRSPNSSSKKPSKVTDQKKSNSPSSTKHNTGSANKKSTNNNLNKPRSPQTESKLTSPQKNSNRNNQIHADNIGGGDGGTDVNEHSSASVADQNNSKGLPADPEDVEFLLEQPDDPPELDREGRVREAERQVAEALAELESALLNRPNRLNFDAEVLRSSTPLEELEKVAQQDIEEFNKLRWEEQEKLAKLRDEARTLLTQGVSESCKRIIDQSDKIDSSEEHINRLIDGVFSYIEENYKEVVRVLDSEYDLIRMEARRNTLRRQSLQKRGDAQKKIRLRKDVSEIEKKLGIKDNTKTNTAAAAAAPTSVTSPTNKKNQGVSPQGLKINTAAKSTEGPSASSQKSPTQTPNLSTASPSLSPKRNSKNPVGPGASMNLTDSMNFAGLGSTSPLAYRAGKRPSKVGNMKPYTIEIFDSDEEKGIAIKGKEDLGTVESDDEMDDNEVRHLARKAKKDIVAGIKKSNADWKAFYTERKKHVMDFPTRRLRLYPQQPIEYDLKNNLNFSANTNNNIGSGPNSPSQLNKSSSPNLSPSISGAKPVSGRPKVLSAAAAGTGPIKKGTGSGKNSPYNQSPGGPGYGTSASPLNKSEKLSRKDAIKMVHDMIKQVIVYASVDESIANLPTLANIKERKRVHEGKIVSNKVRNQVKGALALGHDYSCSAELIREVVNGNIYHIAQEVITNINEVQGILRYALISSATAAGERTDLEPLKSWKFGGSGGPWTQREPEDQNKFETCAQVLFQMRDDEKKKKAVKIRNPYDPPRSAFISRAKTIKEKSDDADGSKKDVTEEVSEKKDEENDVSNAVKEEEDTDVIVLRVADVPFYRVMNKRNIVPKRKKGEESPDDSPKSTQKSPKTGAAGLAIGKQKESDDQNGEDNKDDIPLPRPLTFDPKQHDSWRDERKLFSSGAGPQKKPIEEFFCIDRLKQLNSLDKGKMTGFFSKCTVRYTRPLGLIIAIATERGYLGDSYLYVVQLPKIANTQKYLLGFRDMRPKKHLKPGEVNPLESFDGNAYFAKKAKLIREATVSNKKLHDVQISTDGSRIITIEKETFKAYQIPVWIEEEHRDNRIVDLHQALEVDAKYMRREGQDEYALTNLIPEKCCFYSELSIMGSNEASIVGLRDGTIVKLNHGNTTKVLPDAIDFGTPGVSIFPMWWERIPPDTQKERDKFAEAHPSWHTIEKEYFERHDSKIIFLGCTQTDSLIWSVDERNLICCWRYTLKHRSGFGTFKPLCIWRVDFDDVVLIDETGTSEASDSNVVVKKKTTAKKYNARFTVVQGGAASNDHVEEDYQNLNVELNEHFLYPFYLDEEFYYFPANEKTFYRVNIKDLSKRKITAGDQGDESKNSLDDNALMAGGEEESTGTFAEEHLYGVKVPLLSSFENFCEVRSISSQTNQQNPQDPQADEQKAGGPAVSEGPPLRQFTFFGKTAGMLYKVPDSNIYRVFIFSSESELQNAEEEFTTLAGKRAQLLKTEQKGTGNKTTGKTLSISTDEEMQPNQPVQKSKTPAPSPTTSTKKGGLFSGLTNLVTAPVTGLAAATTAAAGSVANVANVGANALSLGGPTDKKDGASVPGTMSTRQAVGVGQDFDQLPTPSDDHPMGRWCELPKVGSKSRKILDGESFTEDEDEEEELAYFTATQLDAQRLKEYQQRDHDTPDDDDDDNDDEDGNNNQDPNRSNLGGDSQTGTGPGNASSAASGSGSPDGGPAASPIPSSATGEGNSPGSKNGDGGPGPGNGDDAAWMSMLAGVRQKKKQVKKDPVKSLAKIKFQLPVRNYDSYDSKPMMAIYKLHCWIVDELYIYCYSIKTGQRLISWAHGIVDPELDSSQKLKDDANLEDDNGNLPNIIYVAILNVFAPKLILVVATNFVVKFYWIPVL